MKQKINRTANTVMAVVCLLIGLALLAGGIYLLSTADGDALTGGVLVGLGAFIVVLFACTMYLIFNFEKLQQKAEERAEQEAERRRAERRLEADRLRSERAAARGAELPPAKVAPDQTAEHGDDNIENAG